MGVLGVVSLCFFWRCDVAAMVFMMDKGNQKTPDAGIVVKEDAGKVLSRIEGDFHSLDPRDLQKITEYIQALPGEEDRRITRALNTFEKDLPNSSQKNCSQGVRQAIMAERGIDIFRDARAREVGTFNGREAATIYGLDRMLRRNGYELISSGAGYVPQRGDVQSIFFGQEIDGYAGHVQYFDGSSWISDYKQNASANDPNILRAGGVDPGKVEVWTYRRKSS